MTPSSPIKLKIQLLCGQEIAMGPGKADLLDAIAEHGSISAAARAMDMSYRRAWLLVDAMNRCWKEPLVETSPGRAKAGSARLSGNGRHVLASYRRLQAAVTDVAHGADWDSLSTALREEPLTPRAATTKPENI
jgi:molybdate transport system regulatory protein